MSQSNMGQQVGSELSKADLEPLLPIEKKLIGWSFGIGVVLLLLSFYSLDKLLHILF